MITFSLVVIAGGGSRRVHNREQKGREISKEQGHSVGEGRRRRGETRWTMRDFCRIGRSAVRVFIALSQFRAPRFCHWPGDCRGNMLYLKRPISCSLSPRVSKSRHKTTYFIDRYFYNAHNSSRFEGVAGTGTATHTFVWCAPICTWGMEPWNTPISLPQFP